MAVRVEISQSLSDCTGGKTSFEVEGTTFGEVIDAIDARHPGFRGQILKGDAIVGWLLVSGGGRSDFNLASNVVTDGTKITISMNVPGG